MQSTLTYNPRDVLEVQAAINHLTAVAAMLTGTAIAAPAVIAVAAAIAAEQEAPAKAEPRPTAKKTEKKAEPKVEPKEEPKVQEPETPPADDLDNFDEPKADDKPIEVDDLRAAVRAALAKSSESRTGIAAILGKYTTSKQLLDVAAKDRKAVLDAINAL